MGLFDGIGSWVTEQASRAATAAGNTANWIGDGIMHPADAIGAAVTNIANAPSYYDALNHGFTSVEAYQAYLAKQPQGNVPNNPVNTAINNVVNAVPGLAPIAANGANYGTSFGAGSPNGSGLNVGMAPTPRPNNTAIPGDTQINAAADAYKTQQGPPHLSMPAQDGQIDQTSGLAWSAGQGKWVSPAEYTAFKAQTTKPASTVPASTSTVNASDLRVGDHRTYNGVYQTWNGVGWNNGNSAAAPSDPAGSVPLQQSQAPQVSTATQNPVQTPQQWAAARDAINARFSNDPYYTRGLQERDLAALGPQPTANPTNPALPATPSNPSTNPTPLPAQVPTNPATANPAAGAAAAGAVGAGVAGLAAPAGIDPSTWALIAGGGASGIASFLASHEQAQAAKDAANAQMEAAKLALAQQQKQFDATNAINKGIYDTQQANIEPWLNAGHKALDTLSDTVRTHTPFDMSHFEEDPGYHFRLDEGLKALENSAAARGGLLSGNTGKALVNYGQQAGSQEYGAAFNRYQTEYGNKIAPLQSLAGVGQTAVGQSNTAGSGYASSAQQAAQNNSTAQGNLITGAGNALATGYTGAANANASGYLTGASILNNTINEMNRINQGNATNALTAKIYGVN